MQTDLLSDMLGLMHVRGGAFGRLNAGGTWATPLSSADAIKFVAATHGACWFFTQGMAAPARIAAGDVLIVNGTAPLVMANDPALIASASDSCPDPDENGHFQYGVGLDFSMLSGGVQIDAERQTFLQRSLPPIMHVRSDVPEALPLAWLVERLVAEMGPRGEQGQTTTINALTQLLFVQTLRAYMAHASAEDAGWLKVFGDGRLTAALAGIHGDLAHPWTLEELAGIAGMSRTAFAVRFREVMGVPPLAYVTDWRMRLARRVLRAGASVSEAAAQAGYVSESAFSGAFKRETGSAPGAFRRSAQMEAA